MQILATKLEEMRERERERERERRERSGRDLGIVELL
jgi:hypothetical protein